MGTEFTIVDLCVMFEKIHSESILNLRHCHFEISSNYYTSYIHE